MKKLIKIIYLKSQFICKNLNYWKIDLENIIPEEKKPKVIPIGENKLLSSDNKWYINQGGNIPPFILGLWQWNNTRKKQ